MNLMEKLEMYVLTRNSAHFVRMTQNQHGVLEVQIGERDAAAEFKTLEAAQEVLDALEVVGIKDWMAVETVRAVKPVKHPKSKLRRLIVRYGRMEYERANSGAQAPEDCEAIREEAERARVAVFAYLRKLEVKENLKKPSPAHLARRAEEQRSKTREERTFDILCGTYATLVSRIRECLDEGRIEDAKTRLEDLHAALRN